MAKILYVGGFVLPDRNAAAQRVVSIAKTLRDLGHDVIFLNYSILCTAPTNKEYFDFECIECPKRNLVKQLIDIKDVKDIIKKHKISHVIAYNYPSIALSTLIKFCKNREIKIFADVTEWYAAQGNILFRVIKTLDTEYRMQVLHKKTDGIIAISDYLYKYYKDDILTVKIPATVDTKEKKWSVEKISNDETIFAYAGQPDAQKERIDIIVAAIEKLSMSKKVKFRVIGITQKQYEEIYNVTYNGNATEFLGRIPHSDVIKEVTNASWTIVIRENNKVVKAGFPTKIAESIACGTPVIANCFSNISDYLNEENSILCMMDEIPYMIEKACKEHKTVDRTLFDYRRYTKELDKLFTS